MAAHLIHDKLVGAYVYALLVDGVVRYVGKGRRYRVTEHFRWAREINRRRAAGEKLKALPVHNRLAKALRTGAVLSYQIIAFGLDDAAAYQREKEEIAAIGVDNLWNVTRGGDGLDGTLIRALWKDESFRARLMATRRARMYENPEFQQRQRENAVKQWADPEAKARFQKKHRELWDNPELAAERRALLKKVWADPARSARKSELVRSQWTPERRAAMSENRRRAWSDPEFKKRVTAKVAATRALRKKG